MKSKLLVLLLFAVSAFAGGSSHEDGHEDTFDPSAMIIHHIGDSHEWHLFDFHGESYVIPLPIILYSEKNGLDVFLSTNFVGKAHGPAKYKDYILDHEHITMADGSHVLDLSITKNVASMLFAVVLLFVVMFSVRAGYSKNKGKAPKGIQSFFEPLILFIRDEVAVPNLGHNAKKFLPFLLTIFFFILFNNLLGLIPTGANASGNIGFTMVLAVIVALVTNFSGKSAYWKHIFAPPGVPLLLYPIIVPIEILGILTKPFALMIRLFANITAGHIIILSLFSFIFVFKSWQVGIVSAAFVTLMTFMELFVAFLQAFIFTMLAALFIGTAANDHHEEHH
ncbi:MAG: F0F1 ATP synthase subunit A [Cytophagales bacterium]